MIFEQLFDKESSTFTYILADEKTREAVIIDPVDNQVRRDFQFILKHNLKLLYLIETHVHADHITGSGMLKKLTGAEIIVPDHRVRYADRIILNGGLIQFGNYRLRAMSTPGHTEFCTSFVLDEQGMVFTGDALLIHGTGRTDFQGGNAGLLYMSITDKLFSLPDETQVFPGHDYKGRVASSIGEEKRQNPRIAGNNLHQFETIMNKLNLPNPRRMLEAVPANQMTGFPQALFSDLEVGPGWLASRRDDAVVFDVRPSGEIARDGQISKAIRIDSLEQAFLENLLPQDRPIVVSCRSGKRSLETARLLRCLGFHHAYSLKGGLIGWQGSGQVVEKAA